MFPWSVDPRVDPADQHTHFPKWRTYQRRTTLNPNDISGSKKRLLLLVELQRSDAFKHRHRLVSDLHLRWKHKTEPVLRLAINELLIAITTRVHEDAQT